MLLAKISLELVTFAFFNILDPYPYLKMKETLAKFFTKMKRGEVPVLKDKHPFLEICFKKFTYF